MAACTDPTAYYAGATLASGGAALKAALHNIISPHNVVSYDDCWDALRDLDRSPMDGSRVRLIYSDHTHAGIAQQGISTGWNREHAWPKSYGVGYSGPDFSDLHHLFAADWNVNSARNNLYFDDCPTNAGCTSPAHAEAAPTTAKDATRFQPPADRRGDIARAMFYMAVRYDGGEASTSNLELSDAPDAAASTLGRLSALLAWHKADPVSAEERQRNERICSTYQANRNPFIDRPDFAPCVFLGDCTPSPSAPPMPPRPPAPPPSPPLLPTPLAPPSLPPLGAGDCAVVALHADAPDGVSVVLLRPLAAGRTLYLTDGGVHADGTLRDSEGVRAHEAEMNEPAGTLLHLANFSVATSGSLSLSATGDQAVVFSGSAASPTYLCALSTSGAWQATADSSTTSALPKGLVDGVSAIALPHMVRHPPILSKAAPPPPTPDGAGSRACVCTNLLPSLLRMLLSPLRRRSRCRRTITPMRGRRAAPPTSCGQPSMATRPIGWAPTPLAPSGRPALRSCRPHRHRPPARCSLVVARQATRRPTAGSAFAVSHRRVRTVLPSQCSAKSANAARRTVPRPLWTRAARRNIEVMRSYVL